MADGKSTDSSEITHPAVEMFVQDVSILATILVSVNVAYAFPVFRLKEGSVEDPQRGERTCKIPTDEPWQYCTSGHPYQSEQILNF